jgi:hypothetical protein
MAEAGWTLFWRGVLLWTGRTLMRLPFVTIVLAVTMAACGQDRIVLYVGPDQVPCTGVADQLCMLVREDPAGDWEYFYDPIRGFDYEPGYNYTLLVRRDRVSPVAADASSLRWTLVRILDKERAAGIAG